MRRILVITFMAIINILGCGKEVSHTFNDTADETQETFEVVTTLFSDAAGITMTNAAAIGTEITSNISRTMVNLEGFTQMRGHFASSLTSAVIACRVDYSIDNGTSWTTLISTFNAGTVANQNSYSGYTAIPTNGKTTVLLRAVIAGDGVLDPIIRYVRVGYY